MWRRETCKLESMRGRPQVAESIFNFFRGNQGAGEAPQGGTQLQAGNDAPEGWPPGFVLTGTGGASKMIVQAGGTTSEQKDRLRAGRFRPRLETHQGQEARHLHPRREAIACSLGTVSFSRILGSGTRRRRRFIGLENLADSPNRARIPLASKGRKILVAWPDGDLFQRLQILKRNQVVFRAGIGQGASHPVDCLGGRFSGGLPRRLRLPGW